MPQFFDEPVKNFRFIVEVDVGGERTVAAFTQFSGIKMQLETVLVRSGAERRGVMEDIPTLTRFENVTLTKGVIGDHEFLDWIFACAPSHDAPATGTDMSRTINVVALDDRGRRAITWSLIDAMPVSYELGGMDSNQAAVLSETVEFGIGGFKRETHLPEGE